MKLALEKEKQEHNYLIDKLKQHIQFLESDSLQGRITANTGAKIAMDYLVKNYQFIGLEPINKNNYIQEFEYNEGKSFLQTKTYFKVDDIILTIDEDYFPLAFSHQNMFKSNATIALRENGEVWFFDLKDILEENKANPNFDVETIIKNETNKATTNGATALVLLNSSNIIDNISFNKRDTSSILPIPVIYIKPEAQKKYFNDILATLKIDCNIEIKDVKRKVYNVIGFINNNADNTIILGTHYKLLGFWEDKNALDTINGIYNGVSDNTSGCAGLLELATMIKKSNCKSNNYVFIHFGGEEIGFIGSKYWLENPTINLTPNYMINMEMIGKYDTANKLKVGGLGTSPNWSDVLPKTSNLLIKYDSTESGPSDHYSFYKKDIPVLFFSTGSQNDYHKPTDNHEKMNFDAQANIVKYIYNVVLNTNEKGKLKFTKSAETDKSKSNSFAVSLGIIPDYGFTGIGVRADGISSGKLAEKIGLLSGDILTQLGENKFSDVNSYMQTLSKFKKGETTTLHIKRKEEKKEFLIVF